MEPDTQLSLSDRLLLLLIAIGLLLNGIATYLIADRVSDLEARPTVVISPEAIMGGPEPAPTAAGPIPAD
jgi:hypothetical protein